jgi:hypothetical protein
MGTGELIALLLTRLKQQRLIPGFWERCFVITTPGLPEVVTIRQTTDALEQFINLAASVGLEEYFRDLVASRSHVCSRKGLPWFVEWTPASRCKGDVIALSTWLFGGDRPLDPRFREE